MRNPLDAQVQVLNVRRDQFSGPRMHQGCLDIEDVHLRVERDCDAIVMGARGMGAVGSLVQCSILFGT